MNKKPFKIPELFNLSDRVVFLTGASGHLGTEMAEALLQAGAHVILNGRDNKKLNTLHESLLSVGSACSISCFDITNEEASSAAIADIQKRFGRLDVLINNAYRGKSGTVAKATSSDFASAYETIVTAAFRLTQHALPLLEEAGKKNPGGASVINVGTMYGMVSPDPNVYDHENHNPPFYGAAKAGLLQLSRYLACHLAPQRIRVNSLSPGPFPPSDAGQPLLNALRRKVPLGRIGEPHEIRGPILFLASDASSYVTGTNLVIDGGWTAW